MSDEEYVRSRWVDCDSAPPVLFAEHWQVWCGAYFFVGRDEQSTWSAAYAFTLEREQQKREVEEEIHWMESLEVVATTNAGEFCRQRIVKRLQEVLADKKRGMKERQ